MTLRAFWPIKTPVEFQVFGTPEPFPKKDVGIQTRGRGKPRLVPVDKDYRTRKNPDTKKIEKFDHGYKRDWMRKVRQKVANLMQLYSLRPFPKNHPVAMGCLFFLKQADSNKLWLPSQDPDYDNLLYAIMNALKREPNKRGVRNPRPDGTLMYEDNQVVWQLSPSGMLWSTRDRQPGVVITVQDAYHCEELLTYLGG
jgi:Holliday junction resolvase RusA-like endonuclease